MFKKRNIIIFIVVIIVVGIFSFLILSENNSVDALSKYGSRGNEVTQIQTKLKNWGYYTGAVDRNLWEQNRRSGKIFPKKKWTNSRWNSRAENISSNGNI